MISMPAGLTESSGVVTAWRHLRWHHPEWTLTVAAVSAWVMLFATARATGGGSAAMTMTSAHADHRVPIGGGETHHVMSTTHWTLMVVAMMLPSILPTARFVALTGKWKRRQRGPALFAVGYLTVWIVIGLFATTILRHTGSAVSGRWAVFAALVVAALWELSVWKPRFLRACHRHPPVPPDGWKADRACLQRGARNAVSCLGACWALMAPMLVADHVHALWLMMPLAAVIAYQKAGTASRVVRPVAVGLAATAGLVALW
jgi:predicted metal-binding membrane protein